MSRSLSLHVMGIVANVLSTEVRIPTRRCFIEDFPPDNSAILRFLDVPFSLKLVECLTFVLLGIVLLLVDWIELTARNICGMSLVPPEWSAFVGPVELRDEDGLATLFVERSVVELSGGFDTVWVDEFSRSFDNSSMVWRLRCKFRISSADKLFQSMTIQQAYKLKLTWLESEPYYI